MRCIFCKAKSDESISVEHIIPESLGNVEHILPSGWVCDACNNYFSRKVEKPFLDSLYGRSARFEMRVPSKKGRVPSTTGFHAQSRIKVEVYYSRDNILFFSAAQGEDASRWVASLRNCKTGTIYIPSSDHPESGFITSRFIGKIALEVLAKRFCVDVPGWNDEVVDKPELDELRGYVRKGLPKIVWPVHSRRIYAQNLLFSEQQYGPHEVLHEFDILHAADEYYVVVAIFGIEYTINLGGPELDGYYKWLKSNNDRSPLYPT